MRLYLLLAALLLAACGGAVQPAASDQQPAATFGIAGQAVVIEATLESLAKTQAFNQAEIADATSRAAVATAQWQGTQSALVVQATQDALRRANDAATATAAIAQDRATQAAGQTSTAQSFAALSMQQAITATGTAIAARAAAVSTEESAKAQTAIYNESANREIREFLYWAIVVIVALAGLTILTIVAYFAFMVGLDVRKHNHDMLGQKLIEAGYHAEIERANKERALIVVIDNENYYASPGGLVPFGQKVEQAVETKARASKLRTACKLLVYAAVQLGQDGEEYPFSERALVIRNSVVTRPDTGEPWVEGYRLVVGVLKSKSVGILAGKGGKATNWSDGWSLERFEREFDMMPLPDVPESAIPDVRVTLRGSAVNAVSRSSAVPQLEDESENENV